MVSIRIIMINISGCWKIKKTPDDMPNVDMPISRAYEIAQLPKNLIERTYNVNGKSKPIYKMNIKQIKNLKEYV